MADQKYHAFWINSYGNQMESKVSYDTAEIIALRLMVDRGDIGSLQVVYGVAIEFEPAKVVESYKIKE